MNELVTTAAGYVKKIMENSLKRQASERVLVVFDRQSGLSSLIADAYQMAVPDAEFVDFDKHTPAQIMERINMLKPSDVVALVQSTSFRLNEFRLRIELFNRKLKTVEHMHLDRMTEDQWPAWVGALSFDPNVDGVLARELKGKIDTAKTIEIVCGEHHVIWDGEMEPAKLNIGDYTGMENIGGTFPIGEVFSEAKDLSKVNGALKIYAFAGDDFRVRFFEPFTVIVKDGMIEAGEDAPEEFVAVLEKIRANERAIVREFGIGLNASITREHPVNDITAFERTRGLHMSLGEKHGVFKKPGFSQQKTRFHVDIFPYFDELRIDGERILL